MAETLTIRPYQQATLDAISTALSSGKNRLLVKKPTGTGKTVTFAQLPKHLTAWLRQFPPNERRMLVIAHREELLDQAAAKIQAANPTLTVMVEQADRVASPYADVVVASIQTLAARRFARLERLMLRMVFRIVVVDEAHHAAAKTYRAALAVLGFLPKVENAPDNAIEAVDFDDEDEMKQTLATWDQLAPKNRVLVGVTATPNRSDAIGLSCVFQDLVYSYHLRQAIADGWLVPMVPLVLSTDVSLDGVRTTAGDFNQKQLAAAVNNDARNMLTVAGWLQHGDRQPTICFTVDVAHAHALTRLFQDAGVKAEAVSGETPREDRQRILRQYQEGQVEMLVNCMVLTEGTDLPRTACILHAKPTQSATLYEQMTGRGLRLYPGKTRCLVLDVVDLTRRHSLLQTPQLVGLPPGLLANGKDVNQLADEWDRLKEQYPFLDQLLDEGMTIDQVRVKAETFDLWTIPSLGPLATGTTMQWMAAGTDIYQLRYPWGDGTEIVQIAPDLVGKWDVTCTLRPKDGGAVRQRTIMHGLLDPITAASVAEGYVQQERQSVTRLKDKSAPWRTREASPKQLGLLRRLRIPYKPDLTAGEASDLIDMGMSRRGGR